MSFDPSSGWIGLDTPGIIAFVESEKVLFVVGGDRLLKFLEETSSEFGVVLLGGKLCLD